MSTIINVKQGSPEWHEHRANHFNASDATAMMGMSPYCTRTELVERYATGITPEVGAALQKLFDDGHRAEAAARPIAERIIGEELYPVVMRAEVEGLPLSASADGLTMSGDTGFEHKLRNQSMRIEGHTITPETYHAIQMEQLMLVTGAKRVLFMASRGDEKTEVHCWYGPDHKLRAKIIAGWKQFAADVAAYKANPPKVADAEAVGRAPDNLPALRIAVTGQVTSSNLDSFQARALAVFDGINKDLQTDEDFANAEKAVKWCGDFESQLDAAKQYALAQTESIDDLFRTIDSIKATARQTRLTLDKLVKARKQQVRVEIWQEAAAAYEAHCKVLQKSLSDDRRGPVPFTPDPPDFTGAMKGKKTIQSLRDAADGTLAAAKIAANAEAEELRANLKCLSALTAGHEALFADWQSLIQKQPEDLEAAIKLRLAEAAERKRKQAEAEAVERQRNAEAAAEKAREHIRHEEAEKLRREQEAQEADRQCKDQEVAAAEEAASRAALWVMPAYMQPKEQPSAMTHAEAASKPDALDIWQADLDSWTARNHISGQARDELEILLMRFGALRAAA